MELQARVHFVAGFLGLPDPARARDELDAAVAKFTELGLEEMAAEAGNCLIMPALAEGDPAAVKRVIEQSGAFYEARPDSFFYCHLPAYRAMIALQELNLDVALAECQEGVRRSRASGDMTAHMNYFTSLQLHRLVGDHAAVDRLAREAAAAQDFDLMFAATGFAHLALSRWLHGERIAARELAMKARGCYAAMGTGDLALATAVRRLWAVISTEPRFADFERLVRLPPRVGAIALMKGMFDELAMLDAALGREQLAAKFRTAAEELNAEFEAAMESSSLT